MHPRRLTSLFLGAWLAGSLFMWMVATQNFKSVDRLLGSPAPQAKAAIDKLGHGQARIFLRHQAGEQNRWYFETWERAQIVLGLLVLLGFVFGVAGDRGGLLLSSLMLIAVLIQHWYITPEIVRLGRAIDFIPAGEPSVERTRFWMFHNAYSGVELLKLALGAILSAKLIFGRARRRRSSSDTSDGLA